MVRPHRQAAFASADDPLDLHRGGIGSFVVPILGMRSRTTVSGTKAQRIAQVAERQRGRISRAQLLQIGVGPNSAGRLVRKGGLIRVQRGVYAVAHRTKIPLADETAALLALRDGAALALFTAAELWNLEVPRFGDRLIHAVVAGSPGGRPHNVKVHRVTHLDRRDVRIHDGLPVTSPILTLLQLVAHLATPALEIAIHQALYRRLIRATDLEELVARSRNQHGAAQLRTAAGRADAAGLTASQAERRLLALIHQAQLPTPLVNHRQGSTVPDFLWPDHGVILELDDWTSHQTPKAFEHDRRRDARNTAQGMQTSRVTVRQVRDEPFAVIARLAAQLALAAAQRARTQPR